MHHPVAPVALRPVEGLVCPVDQDVLCRGPGGHPDRHRHPQVGIHHGEFGLLDCQADSFRNLHRPLPGAAGKHDDELLATKAGAVVTRADLLSNRGADLLQDDIAACVSVAVVDPLEEIDVEIRQGNRQLVLLLEKLEIAGEMATVVQPGQRILEGLIGERGSSRPLVLHVPEDERREKTQRDRGHKLNGNYRGDLDSAEIDRQIPVLEEHPQHVYAHRDGHIECDLEVVVPWLSGYPGIDRGHHDADDQHDQDAIQRRQGDAVEEACWCDHRDDKDDEPRASGVERHEHNRQEPQIEGQLADPDRQHHGHPPGDHGHGNHRDRADSGIGTREAPLSGRCQVDQIDHDGKVEDEFLEQLSRVHAELPDCRRFRPPPAYPDSCGVGRPMLLEPLIDAFAARVPS